MSLFLHERTEISAPPRPRVHTLAVVSLMVTVSGFLNIIGFLVGPVLAHIALIQLRQRRRRGEVHRGRHLAIAALCIAYFSLIVGAVAFLLMLVVAMAQLPTPHFSIHSPFH